MVEKDKSSDLHELKVYAEQVRLLYKPFLVSVFATFTAAFLLAVSQRNVIEHSQIYSWLLILIVLTSLRALLFFLYKKKNPDIAESKRWGQYFIIGVIFSGAAWGLGAVMLFPENNSAHQIFVIAVILGICSGAVTSISVMRGAALLFLVPAMLPLLPLLFIEGGELSYIIACMVVLAFIFYKKGSDTIYRNTQENIHLRIQAEENNQKQHDAKQFQRTLLDTSPDYICVLNLEGEIQKINRVNPDSVKEDILGKKASDFVPDDYQDDFKSAFQKVIKTGKLQTVNTMAELSDGKHYFLNRLNPVKISGEELVVLIATDITSLKLTEMTLQNKTEQLEESDVRLNQVLSSSPVVIYTCEVEGDYAATYVSENVNELFGYNTEQFLDDPGFWLNGIHPDDAPKVFEELGNLFKHGKHSHEYRFKLANGEYVWVHDELKLVKDSQGNPLEIIGYWADITDRKNAEVALQEKTRQLQSVISSAPLILWSSDNKGMFTFSDGRGLENMGFKPNEVVGQSVFELYADYPDVLDAARKVLSGEYVTQENFVTGSWYESHYIPVLSEQGEVQTCIGVAIDITDRKNAEAEIIASKQEAERANQAKSDFLSSMSHELRTPMNSIIGFGQLLELTTENSEHKKYVGNILKASEHLLKLINEVLDLSRIESGKEEIVMEGWNLNSILDDSLLLIGPIAAKRDIKIINNVSSELDDMIYVDNSHYKQVLLNLLSNAVKYNKEGGSVTLSCDEIDDKHLRINVTDTGDGLTEDQQRRLFQPFERLEVSNNIQGTGIGLVISQRLVKMMGGKIGIESEYGKGSTFWVQVERGKGINKNLLNDEVEEKQTEKKADLTKSILYIENDLANIALMDRIISSSTSYKLTTITDAKKGLVIAEEQKPDLILMDINMPAMNGYDALKELQKNDAIKHIPVVAVSANAMSSDIEKGQKAGFHNYITKPFNIKEIVESIDEVFSSQLL